MLTPSVLIPVRLWHKSGALPYGRSSRRARPLDPPLLDALAVRYVARYATTQAKLMQYLVRKVKERGWADDEAPPPLAEIVARCVTNGFVDDRAFAETRAASLARRGFGHRRVVQSLQSAGIGRDMTDALAPDEAAAFAAAEAFARRRRFGAFGPNPDDPALRSRQIAAMMRAGHHFDLARFFVENGVSDSNSRYR